MEVLLPWERLLWSGRPRPTFRSWSAPRERYFLTDVRLIAARNDQIDEMLLHDIVDVRCTESGIDHLVGTSTLAVQARDDRRAPIVLQRIRRGPQLAALLELLSSDPRATPDVDTVRATLSWEPRLDLGFYHAAFTSLAATFVVLFAVAISVHGKTPGITFPSDDAIYPSGHKRSQAEIVQFMEEKVLPWARVTLGPLKGGPDRITCGTCHGPQPDRRSWEMPSVAALPLPDLAEQGWEIYSASMDAQTRNAIYGYIAEADNQAKAAYMREVVMPGMARLLRRPAYDFTKPYGYNRTRAAFGCYHCHRVK